MNIKLVMDIPVGKEHGLTEGRIFKTISEPIKETGGVKYIEDRVAVEVIGDIGEKVKILGHEYEEVRP